MPISDPMWHDLGAVSPGAYEWLYFDVLNTKDKAHVSIDFLAPNPFDTRLITTPTLGARDRVGVIACVSRPDKPGIEIDCQLLGESLVFSGDKLAIGGSSATRFEGIAGLPVYELQVNAVSADGAQRITGKLTFESLAPEWSIPGGQYYEARNDPNQYHRWVVHVPRATAKGHLTVDGPGGRFELEIDGHGYHDHNFGTVPLAATVQSWFWARGSDEEHTVIAAHLVPKAAFREDRWLDNVVYVGTSGRSIAGAVGDQSEFAQQYIARGANGVDYPGLVSFQTEDLRRAPVKISLANQQIAIDGHPGYLRRYVDLSLAVGREDPHVFRAVAEDIVFP